MELKIQKNNFLTCASDNKILKGKELFEILTTGYYSVTSGKEIIKLIISKRPANLKFKLTLTPSPLFTIWNRKEEIVGDALVCASEFGYYLDDKRIIFLSENTISQLKKIQEPFSLPVFLKLIKELKQKHLLLSVPDNLLDIIGKAENYHVEGKTLFIRELYPYQKKGVDWLVFCSRHGLGTILADDMGLGKTAQVIALICDTLEKTPESRILIVVPNPLLENWKREFKFFAPSITPFIHYGNNRHGLASGLDKYKVIITPYTTMTSDISLLEDMPFRLALFDEASMLKNHTSARAIAAKKIDAVVKIAMTGTPVENSLTDAWSLSNLVFEGYLGGFKEFKDRYVCPDIRNTLDNDLNDLEISLQQITLRRMKKNVLEQLPEKQDIHLPVSMSSEEIITYQRYIREMKGDKKNGGAGILLLINKLQQFTAHPALLDHTIETNYQSLCRHSSKFELLIMRTDKIMAAGEKVLIFATFQKMVDLLASAMNERYGIYAGKVDGRTPNKDRQGLIDLFSESEGFDVLVLHPRTAGMGLNITAASHVIHYSRQWNPALEEQATARAWRNGQKKIVSAYYLYFADTIEQDIDERLRLKRELSDKVVTITDDKETDKKIMMSYLEKYND